MTVPPHGNGFPERLQHAVDASGLTLEGIQRRLAGQGHVVGRSTLSYWQNGRRLPTGANSIAAVAALEQILKTRPGALIEALAQHPPTRRVHSDPQAVRDRIDQIIGRADEEEGRQRAYEVVGSLTAGRYGALGELESMEMMIAIRALSDLQRVTFAHGCEPGDDPNLVEYVVLSGGRIGRVTYDERERVVFGEIIFDRQLRRGESHLYRYELRDANHQRTERYFKVLDMQSAFVAIELTFHPTCLPVQIEEFDGSRRPARTSSTGTGSWTPGARCRSCGNGPDAASSGSNGATREPTPWRMPRGRPGGVVAVSWGVSWPPGAAYRLPLMR